MSTGLKSVKDIPSISEQYRKKVLKPSDKEDLPTPNQQINSKICTYQGDITKLQVDAIVNAANSGLRGGGGVDGAIQRAAGPDLLRECATLGGCETGSAKITDAYNLPCKKVIHAVGPIYESIQESEPLLRGAYRKSLMLAVEYGCKTVAFPAISTGIYGYPSNAAARAALREFYAFLRKPEGQKLDKIVICNFLDKDVDAYAECLPTVFPPTEDDLSHTGEYDPEEKGCPKDQLPTETQTRSRETYEPVEAARLEVTADENDISPTTHSSQNDSPHDEAVRRSSPASSKRSWDGNDRPSIKRRKEVSSGDTLVGADSRNEEIGSKDTDSSVEASSNTSEATLKTQEDDCHHNRFEKHDGVSSHGLWPYCAMICECGKLKIQCRGTDKPVIGRGDGGWV